MAKLSELVISHPEIVSFDELEQLVVRHAGSGDNFLELDVKPDYENTPKNWAWILEAAFYRRTENDG